MRVSRRGVFVDWLVLFVVYDLFAVVCYCSFVVRSELFVVCRRCLLFVVRR